MILDREPLNMYEVEAILKDVPDNEKKERMNDFIKKFGKLKLKEAKELKEELEKLDLLKLKREYLVKIVDLLPQDMSDLNKIFVDVSLNEEEANKILEIMKNLKHKGF